MAPKHRQTQKVLLAVVCAIAGAQDGPRTEAGDEIDPSVGLVVVVGDSLLDGTGSTKGAFEGTLAARLGTVVYNNAVGGADFGDIMSMRACSSYDACTKWAIADGGINGMDDVSMEDFVSRERAAGASTVIIGYPPSLGRASGPTYDAMMASFATLAAESDDVYFVDPRTHPIMGDPRDPESRPWRAEDNEHPSPRAGEWMANVAADYILGAGGGPDQDAEEATKAGPKSDGKRNSAKRGSTPLIVGLCVGAAVLVLVLAVVVRKLRGRAAEETSMPQLDTEVQLEA